MTDIRKININELKPFKNHPFKVNKDEELITLSESIKENGLINPIIVRPIDKGYEVVSGHRRIEAVKLNGETEIMADIRDLSDDEATIIMVDSNLHRDMLLPSEKAFAYKMKLDAMKHQGKSTYVPSGQKLTSRQELAGYSKDGATTIQRYIRLTYLIPELLKIVDNTAVATDKHCLTMGLRPAVEISYLNKDQQELVYSEMKYDDMSPTHAQAIKIRKLAEKKELDADKLEDIFMEEKGNQHEKISFNKDKIVNALPYEMSKRDKRYIEDYIIKAIESYRELEKERGDPNDLGL